MMWISDLWNYSSQNISELEGNGSEIQNIKEKLWFEEDWQNFVT